MWLEKQIQKPVLEVDSYWSCWTDTPSHFPPYSEQLLQYFFCSGIEQIAIYLFLTIRYSLCIHPFIFCTDFLSKGITGDFGHNAGDTLDGVAAHCRAQSHNLEMCFSLEYIYLRGNQSSSWRKFPWKHRENMQTMCKHSVLGQGKGT